jgi:hypothetical protein
MKRIFLLILALFIFSYSFTHAATGIPSIISYQGRLANASGDLLGNSGTTYYFKFSIWDNSTVGIPNKLWPTGSPTSVPLTVKQGVFNVNIGDTAGGYPDSLNYNFSSNKDIYLQVEVSSDNSSFQTLSPRQRVSSAPFAQTAGAVSGVGQSSFGTTSPISNAVVTIESTTTSSIPLSIKGAFGQVANLLNIQDSSSNHLFSINSLGGIFASSSLLIGSSTATSFIVDTNGNVGVGTASPSRKFNVLNANSTPQLRLSQSNAVYGELYADSTGDIQISSTGGNIRMQDENLWVCTGGSCGVDTPVDKGNIIVETGVIFNNKFKFKQTDASTTIMYDSAGNDILEFDEGQ